MHQRSIATGGVVMTMTGEGRAEVSRRNGRRGRGPKTESGKRKASQGARTHGLRARTVSLVHEDRDAVAGRADQWHGHYRPGSPASAHLANECARSTLAADRADRYLQAVLEEQVGEADAAW